MRPDRAVARCPQALRELAFGEHAGGGVLIAQVPCTGAYVFIAGAGLQCQRALPRRRDELIEDPVRLVTQTPKPRQCQHERVVLAIRELAQAGVDVAANARHFKIIARRSDLSCTPEAGRADASARRELDQ